MKNSIKTIIDGVVSDNAVFIKENGGNAAEYLLLNAENAEFGWFAFLSDDEIAEYESASSERREEIEADIIGFINENYYYNILADELLEKWIVVDFGADVDNRYRVTRRSNFEEMDFCKAYENNGVQLDCYHAGCYSFSNSGSSIFDDFYAAISEKIGPFGSLMDDLELTNQDLVEWLSSPVDSIAFKIGMENFSDWSKMVSFLKSWREENESHTEVTGWTFHDSHNFRTVVSVCDFAEPDCVEMDEDDSAAILLQMPQTAPHIEGTNACIESEDYIFHFDRWATNPWFCYVERK